MPKYCTWEPNRQRWVFQRRVPKAISDRYSGPLMIREHIGQVDEAQAAAYAERRTAELDAEFRALETSANTDWRETNVPLRFERMFLNDDLLPRFLATYQNREYKRFEEMIYRTRNGHGATLDTLMTQLANEQSAALDAFRCGSPDAFSSATFELEKELSVRLRPDASIFQRLVDTFNSTKLRLLKQFQKVLTGDEDLFALRASPEDELPLVEVWGNPALELPSRWRDQRLAAGEEVNLKTLDKYTNIATDLNTILGRRPVQAITAYDLNAVSALWRERGNGARTICQKLGILRSMLGLFVAPGILESLFLRRIARRRKSSAKRLPFSGEQLSQFFRVVRDAPNLSEDDSRCLELMTLTGAHFEEVHQLHATDFDPAAWGWTIRITDANADTDASGTDPSETDTGSRQLKTDECARQLPLVIPDDVFPDLGDWVARRVESGGFIFSETSNNRYQTRSTCASKRLNRALRKLVPHERRLVVQSLRNTASRVMSRAGVDPRVRRRYLGHADVDIHELYYDPADLIDACDLLPAAETILNWLRVECFSRSELDTKGQAYPLQNSGNMRNVRLNP